MLESYGELTKDKKQGCKNYASGKTAAKTYQMMQIACGEKCLPQSTVFLQFGKFQDDREIIQNEDKMGCLRTSQTEVTIEAA